MRARPEVALAIAEVVEGFGMKIDHIDAARVKIYARALQDVPLSVLPQMSQRIIATRKARWGDIPPVTEWLEDAETVRISMRQAQQFKPCEQCSEQGWVSREINGVTRMVRCQCWNAHQVRVAELGAGEVPLALPPARDWTGSERE